MDEVRAKRYAGPYSQVPFNHYIQSPVGLVPKQSGKPRLIFHLSYPRNTGLSVNENTDPTLTSVSYAEFDDAVKLCLRAGKGCFAAKADGMSAFRQLGIRRQDWPLLVLKAQSPHDNKTYYFVDKCLPFGASISCALFQAFSDALAHIVHYKSAQENVNYLDNFFFVAMYKYMCDRQIRIFLECAMQ